MFFWRRKKREIARVEEDTKLGFEAVKKDISAVTGWIKHLDSEKSIQQKEIEDIKELLSSIQNEMEGLKNVFSIMNDIKPKGVLQTPKQVFAKQTGVYAVQTGVQTGVQTPNFDSFSVTERAILWILINSDIKLSYDDLAAMLGKERSTIRGHINRIKQKSEHMVSEHIEKNGKKRVYISEELREKLLKNAKVRVKTTKKPRKKAKNE